MPRGTRVYRSEVWGKLLSFFGCVESYSPQTRRFDVVLISTFHIQDNCASIELHIDANSTSSAISWSQSGIPSKESFCKSPMHQSENLTTWICCLGEFAPGLESELACTCFLYFTNCSMIRICSPVKEIWRHLLLRDHHPSKSSPNWNSTCIPTLKVAGFLKSHPKSSLGDACQSRHTGVAQQLTQTQAHWSVRWTYVFTGRNHWFHMISPQCIACCCSPDPVFTLFFVCFEISTPLNHPCKAYMTCRVTHCI